MKRENIITILVVIFIVLLGVLYIKNEQSKELSFIQNEIRENQREVKEVDVENIQQEVKEILPELVREPYTKETCLQFIKKYHCQEGVETSEGLVGCDPQYQRTEIRCESFLKGEADPYGGNYGINKKEIIHKKEDEGLVCKNRDGKTMSYSEALKIAQNSSICLSKGKIKAEAMHRLTRCGAFPDFIAIPLEVKDANNCNPHCLVNIDTHKVEVNFMCRGLIEPEDYITRRVFNTDISFFSDFILNQSVSKPDYQKFYTLRPRDFQNYKEVDLIFIKNGKEFSCQDKFPSQSWPHQSCFIAAWDRCDGIQTFVYTSSQNKRILKQLEYLKEQRGGCM